MAVGHGQLGGRSNMRTFRKLVGLSQCRRDSFIDVDAGLLAVPPWSASGASWTLAPGLLFEGIMLDATSVRTLDEILTRAESHSDCVATAGTYCYSPSVDFLRIHLSGGVDPNAVSVLITTTFGFTTAGQEHEHMVQPILGPELLTDPDLEDWSSSTNLASYSEDLSGAGWAVNQDTSDFWSGVSSAKLSATGAASGSAAIRQSPNTNLGQYTYRSFGYYMTPPWAPATQHAYVRFGTLVSLKADGRTTEATLLDGYELEPTFGEWASFTYDFMAHEAGARLAFRLVNGSAAASEVHFDKLSLRTIWGWRHYRPLVADGGIPEVVQAAADIYPGSEETGTALVRLINGPGDYMERMFSPPFYYPSREVRWLHGGVFPGGQEILYNDLEPGFGGVVAGAECVSVSDEEAAVQVEDHRSIFSAKLPTRVYNDTDQPNGESRDRGRPRALVFGIKNHARLSRTDIDGTTGYGEYEACDVTDWTDGIGGVGVPAGGTVRAYPDEEAADKMDQTRVVALTDGVDYFSFGTTGTMVVNHDVRVIEINESNNKLDFTHTSTFEATIPSGFYVIGDGSHSVPTFRRGLLAAIRTAMNTLIGATVIDAVYSETTHQVTISTTSAMVVLTLLTDTGVNRANSIFPVLGYDSGANVAGGTAATGVLFTDPDSTHIIRADIAGFADDAAGTYTSVSGGTLLLGPDILRFIFREILGLPTSRLDLDSFIDARVIFPAELGVYLGGLASITGGGGFDLTVGDVIDRLENGAGADDSFLDIVPDGTGKFFYQPRASSAPANAVHLHDRHFLSFRGYYVADDVAATTRINYDQNPSTGVVKGSELTMGDAILLYGRPQTKTFDTFLVDQADADTCCANVRLLTQAAIRHFEFDEVGLLLSSKKGDVILITRAQALQGVGESGGLDADEFIIMELRKNFQTGVCHAVVHTNITP